MPLIQRFCTIFFLAILTGGSAFAAVSYQEAYNQEQQQLREEERLFVEALRPYCDINANLEVHIQNWDFQKEYEKRSTYNEGMGQKYYLDYRSDDLKFTLSKIREMLRTGMQKMSTNQVKYSVPASRIQRIIIERDSDFYSSYADLDEDDTVLKIRVLSPGAGSSMERYDFRHDLPRDLNDEFGISDDDAFKWPYSEPYRTPAGGFSISA